MQFPNKCHILVQYDHTKILRYYKPYYGQKNIFEPHLTPNIMTSSTGDIIKKPQFLFGLLIYTFMQNFRRIAPVAKEIETNSQKSGILIHYDVIIKQTKK